MYKVIRGREIHQDIVIDRDKKIIIPNKESIIYMSSNSYFESIISNHYEFFDPEYLKMQYTKAAYLDIDRIIKRDKDNTNLGKLICNIYDKVAQNNIPDNVIYDYIFTEFYKGINIESLQKLYINKSIRMKNTIYTDSDLPKYNRYEHGGGLLDFSTIGIDSKIYITDYMMDIIDPSILLQIALEYQSIIIGHSQHKGEKWKLTTPINDIDDMQKLIEMYTYGNVLLLVCNCIEYDLHSIDNNRISSINYPKGELIGELYIPNYKKLMD